MESSQPSEVVVDKETMDEKETTGLISNDSKEESLERGGEAPEKECMPLQCSALNWFEMISKEMHWSFVFGVITVNGISQGLADSIWRVATDYYWKDVQMRQPSESQVYSGIIWLPWIVKPLWGLLTDVLPVAGYRRRPYLVLAGLMGSISMLIVGLHKNLHVAFALLALTANSAGVAIADVAIDACAAENSITHPSLAADIQSLCALSASIGGLLGFSISGFLIHGIGSQAVLGLLSIPAAMVFLVGILLKEPHTPNFAYGQVCKKFQLASQTMWTTLKGPHVWRPCIYMYISIALSLNIQEGMFYWYTDATAGPSFAQETVGFIFSVGSVGSLVGVLLYQNLMKDYQFRGLLFWSQLLTSIAGMLDLILVLRLNIKLSIPDFVFIVVDECVSQLIGRLKWMPLLVLSVKLCPSGIEGTFFALLMSIENVGVLSASWFGGLLLNILKVTREDFHNLWAAILIRNVMRILPLALLFLVPKSDQHSTLLPAEMLTVNSNPEDHEAEVEDIELVSLVDNSR